MKKIILLLIASVTIISSCKKDSSVNQAAKDDALIQAYISANNITATKDASGLYYQIITAGTGIHPTVNSTVNVNYSGKLLDGSVFAPTSNLVSPLSQLIKGWQIGIPYANTGARIMLIIPSALGYGSSSPAASIPANSVLVFTIDLVSFTN